MNRYLLSTALRIVSIFVPSWMLCAESLFAQTTTDQAQPFIERYTNEVIPAPKHLFLTSPVRLFWMYNLGYIQAITENIALGGGIELPTSYSSSFGSPGIKSGIGVTAEVRFYPGRAAVRGFYVAPTVNFHSFTVERTINYNQLMSPGQQYIPEIITTNPTPFSMGIITGWTLFLWTDLAIEVGVGFKHHFLSDEIRITSPSGFVEVPAIGLGLDIFRGTVPVVRLSLGYAW
jgi:hypothetical protein